MTHSLTNSRSVAAAVIAATLAARCLGAGTEVFRDDFNGTSFSTTNWSIASWATPHDRTQWGPTALTPVVGGGSATLKLNTYNADSPGSYFKGTEIVSKNQFSLGTGMEFEARIRTNTTTPGIVTAFYLYGSHGVENALSDETDFEFLTKENNPSPPAGDQVYLTNWNDWSSGSDSADTTKHSFTHPTVTGLDVTTFNTLMIRWLPDRTEWYINNALVRSTTQAVPNDPMNLILNIWAPDSSWGSAYSSALQPTASAASNVSHTMDVDYAVARSIPANSWTLATGGTWSAAGNWNAAAAPSGTGAVANFLNIPNSPTTVTLDAPKTVGTITFDSASAYTISGTAALTMAVSSGSAAMTVTSGSHTIAAPVTLASNTTANVAAGSALSITGAVTGAGSLTKSTGTGVLQVASLRIAGLTVSAGTFRLAPDSLTASKVTSLTASTGTFDIANNQLAIDYSGLTPADTIRIRLSQGRTASGSWDGAAGIVSSYATATNDPQKRTAIGYAEAKDVLSLSGTQTTTWLGQTVDATTLLLKYTWYGDANLDGRVTADDYAMLDRGFRQHLAGWSNGDFDYDGTVGTSDYLLIDRAYALQGGTLSPEFLASRESQFGAGYVAELVAAVPEPSILYPLSSLLLTRRKRIA